MRDTAPSMMVPALIAGGSLGFVSGLPIANCACCLWAGGAGFLAAFLYSRSCRRDGAAFDAGKGGIVGLIAGAVFGLLGGAMNSVISLVGGGLDPEAMREAIDASPMISDPEAASQAMQFFESVGPLFLVLLFVLIWLVAGIVFAGLGGLIGGAAFKVEPAPPAAGGGWSAMPPAAPPVEPPPPPRVDPGP
ncbi:MAG: hypothetical protein MUC56_18780 [Thermoanaerobaculales bacterium]|nr:hypothetical protein [Thermoanaerobaculales bacterium]